MLFRNGCKYQENQWKRAEKGEGVDKGKINNGLFFEQVF